MLAAPAPRAVEVGGVISAAAITVVLAPRAIAVAVIVVRARADRDHRAAARAGPTSGSPTTDRRSRASRS